jgi:hypothetical protein
MALEREVTVKVNIEGGQNTAQQQLRDTGREAERLQATLRRTQATRLGPVAGAQTMLALRPQTLLAAQTATTLRQAAQTMMRTVPQATVLGYRATYDPRIPVATVLAGPAAARRPNTAMPTDPYQQMLARLQAGRNAAEGVRPTLSSQMADEAYRKGLIRNVADVKMFAGGDAERMAVQAGQTKQNLNQVLSEWFDQTAERVRRMHAMADAIRGPVPNPPAGPGAFRRQAGRGLPQAPNVQPDRAAPFQRPAHAPGQYTVRQRYDPFQDRREAMADRLASTRNQIGFGQSPGGQKMIAEQAGLTMMLGQQQGILEGNAQLAYLQTAHGRRRAMEEAQVNQQLGQQQGILRGTAQLSYLRTAQGQRAAMQEAQVAEAIRRQETHLRNRARYGRVGGALADVNVNGLGRAMGRVDQVLGMAAGGFAAANAAGLAAMPTVAEHTRYSFQLLAGELGNSMIPALVRVAGVAQDTARWYRSLDEGTKGVIGSTVVYGGILTAGTLILGHAVRGVLALGQAYFALTAAARSAAGAQELSNAAAAQTGLIGPATGRGIGQQSVGVTTGQIIGGVGGTVLTGGTMTMLARGGQGGVQAALLNRGIVAGSEAVAPAGFLARAGLIGGGALRLAGRVALPLAVAQAAYEQLSTQWTVGMQAFRDRGGWSAEARAAGRNPLWQTMNQLGNIPLPGLGAGLDYVARPLANAAFGMNMPAIQSNTWRGSMFEGLARGGMLPWLQGRGAFPKDNPGGQPFGTFEATKRAPGQDLMTSFNPQMFNSGADLREAIMMQAQREPPEIRDQQARERDRLDNEILNQNTAALRENTAELRRARGDDDPGVPTG